MLWPALRALSYGELTLDQVQWLVGTLELDPVPRTEGPGAAQSLAHRSFTDDAGARLVLDLARTGENGWVFALFFHAGQWPSDGTIEAHRARFRQVIDQLSLTLVEIDPAATADEVHVVPAEPAGAPDSSFAAHWDLPGELDRIWLHVGLRVDAPRQVKEVKLRELMGTPAWRTAPAGLRSQAEAFLAGA